MYDAIQITRACRRISHSLLERDAFSQPATDLLHITVIAPAKKFFSPRSAPVIVAGDNRFMSDVINACDARAQTAKEIARCDLRVAIILWRGRFVAAGEEIARRAGARPAEAATASTKSSRRATKCRTFRVDS